MDLGMPNKDGFEASSEILEIKRQEKDERVCNIVAVTSFTDQLSHDRCIDIGMQEVINKPIKQIVIEKLVLKYHFLLTAE